MRLPKLALALGLGAAALAASAPAEAADVSVNCSAGQKLQAAINANPPGTRFLVTGTCLELIVVDRQDNIRIEGVGAAGATIQAPVNASATARVVQIGRSTGVGLTKLIIRGGERGLVLRHGAVVSADRITVRGASEHGIRVQTGSVLDAFRDSGSPALAVFGNGRRGIDVGENSTLNAINLDLYDNGTDGIRVAGGSHAKLDGVRIFDNGGRGVSVDGATVAVGASDLRKSQIFNNTSHGVFCFGGATSIFSDTVAERTEITGNDGWGVWGIECNLGFGNTFLDLNGTAAGTFDGGIAVRDGHADVNRVTVKRSAGDGLLVMLQGTADVYGSIFSANAVSGVSIAERGMVAFDLPKSTIVSTAGPAITCAGGGKALLYGTPGQLFAFSANQSNLAAACTAP